MSVTARRWIERQIVKLTIDALLKAGYELRIERDSTEFCDSYRVVDGSQESLDEMFACDEERLYVGESAPYDGYVYFVYGNDGWDVMNDYTTNLERILAPIMKLADSEDIDAIVAACLAIDTKEAPMANDQDGSRMILLAPDPRRQPLERMQESMSDYVTHLQNWRTLLYDTIIPTLERELKNNSGDMNEAHANLWRIIEQQCSTARWQLDELRRALLATEGFLKASRTPKEKACPTP
jgi:hypothetical protein